MELQILRDIVIIFGLSVFVNLIFTKLKIPTIVGYLLTGIIAGPHLLKLVGSHHEIELMAEIGVVLLLFSIGLEFSLKHLMKIRRVVFLGGFLQVGITALVFWGLSQAYGLRWETGLFIGFIAALSSSALVLKILQDRSEVTSNYGRTVIGILIFQDIMLVPMLLFSNLIGTDTADIGGEIISLLVKTLFIIVFVFVGHKWLFPWLLKTIALAKNNELFFMSILLICLAIALLTSELGMSLAFGAFLAGLMISESEYSHNAFGSLIPFKDTFAIFFFVSIGMLLDLNFVYDNILLVLGTVAAIILIKTIVAGSTGFLLGHTFKGTVLIGLALSQVGEFSFILAKIGEGNGIIPSFYYQLFLAVAVITMSVSPFIFQLSVPFADRLMKLPLPQIWLKGLYPLKEIKVPNLQNHTVIIGKDSVALKLSILAKYVKLPYVSIVFDPVIVKELQEKGEVVIYGDAINEPILRKAHVDEAEIVVVSVGNLITSLSIIERVRAINSSVYIIVRTKVIDNIEMLYKAGADQIFPENFEISIDLFDRILTHRLMPKKELNLLLGKIRTDFYGIFREKNDRNKVNIMDDLPNLEISAIKITEDCKLAGQTLAEMNLRKSVGVTVVSVMRDNELIEHPEAEFIVGAADILYLLGKPEQISRAFELLSPSPEQEKVDVKTADIS